MFETFNYKNKYLPSIFIYSCQLSIESIDMDDKIVLKCKQAFHDMKIISYVSSYTAGILYKCDIFHLKQMFYNPIMRTH